MSLAFQRKHFNIVDIVFDMDMYNEQLHLNYT